MGEKQNFQVYICKKSLLVSGVAKSLLVRCVESNLVDTVDEGVPVQFASRLFLAPVGGPKQKF